MTTELRTAAIEAATKAWRDAVNERIRTQQSLPEADEVVAVVVDAVLPLLVAETASRIADAIEAEANREPKGIREHLSLAGGNWFDRASWLLHAAAIARRVGETS